MRKFLCAGAVALVASSVLGFAAPAKSSLPKAKGTDPFPGAAFWAEDEALRFNKDGTCVTYSAEEDGSYFPESLMEYTCNAAEGRLYLRTAGIYAAPGTVIRSADELAAAALPSQEQETEEFFASVKIDGNSRRLYREFMDKSFRARVDSAFSTVTPTAYELSADGSRLVLRDVPSVDVTAESFHFGLDKTSTFDVSLSAGLISIQNVVTSEDRSLGIGYVGVVQFDSKKQGFSASLYKIVTGYDENFEHVVSFRVSEAGTLKGTCKVSLGNVTAQEGLSYYTATFDVTFSKVPADLKGLKSVRYTQSRPLYEYSFARDTDGRVAED